MKTRTALMRPSAAGLRTITAAIGCWLLAGTPAHAFPPAPHHSFYGVVRNEMGDPLVVTNAVVILESLTGTQVKAKVVPHLGAGLNYQMNVPLDAGITADNYKPTALRPTVAFLMKVKIGNVTYLPIEMQANYANLGKPAKSTRLDLTLGEDLDGDGLPDAWERALIAMLGGNLGLQDIRPGDDADGDGLTNLQEYLAGTYAFDPDDGFRLDMLGFQDGRPLLKFLAITGRTYTLLQSADLKTWTPVPFRISGAGTGTPAQMNYRATDVRMLHVEAEPTGDQSGQLFFKAQVQ